MSPDVRNEHCINCGISKKSHQLTFSGFAQLLFSPLYILFRIVSNYCFRHIFNKLRLTIYQFVSSCFVTSSENLMLLLNRWFHCFFVAILLLSNATTTACSDGPFKELIFTNENAVCFCFLRNFLLCMYSTTSYKVLR